MSKKVVSVFLTILMIMASLVNAGAYFKAGEKNHQLTYEESISVENATVSSRGAVTVTDKGSVTYECLITFPISKVEFSYEAEVDTKLTLYAEGITYGGVLTADNKSYTQNLSTIIPEGERVFKFTFENAVKVNSITLAANSWSKPDQLITDANAAQATIAFTAAEELVHSAIIIDERSSAIMVNGATRYIDNDNITLKPRYFGGNLCLPIHTLARALGYYYEDMPELDFTLMRYGETEYVLRNGVMTKETSDGITSAALPIYRDAYGTWAGIRFFAESIDETVVYDDGTVYIDFKSQIKKIRESAAAKNYVIETLGAFEEGQVTGNTYYVAQTANASDKNPGTEAAPFKTLNKAGQVAKAGDTVIIREGTYREIFTPQNDGTATNPIVFKAAEGEDVVISANEVVDDFLPYGKDGWVCAYLPKDLGLGRNQIFYQDKGIIEARYPNGLVHDMGEGNEPLSEYFNTRGSFLVDTTDEYLVTSPEGILDQEKKDVWKGAIFMSMHGQGYTMCSAIVESSEKGSMRLGKLPDRWWWRPGYYDFFDSGYLQGVKACMDLPGEWIIENNTLIMIPPEGETAESLVVEAKARQLVADFNERKYVHLKGVKTIGGSITMDNTEMCMLDNVDMSYISHFTFINDAREGFLDGLGSGNLGSNSPKSGEVGIWLDGKNNIVKDSTIDHSAGAALYVSGLYAYIEGNKIVNTGYNGSYLGGIFVFPDLTESPTTPRGGVSVYENDISRIPRTAFIVTAPENRSGWKRISFVPNEVAYNRMYDCKLSTLDVGTTYIYGCNASTDRVYSRLHSNYVYDATGEQTPDHCLIYHDGGSEGTYCYNNICFSGSTGSTYYKETIIEHEYGNANWIGANVMLNAPVDGGVDGLKSDFFLNAKPFYAGLPSGRENYMKNYAYEGTYLRLDASDAKLSGGATLENDGRIHFNSKTALATFENVDFGDKGLNKMDIYFAGTRQANEWPRMSVKIGDTYETSEIYMFLARSEHYSNRELVNSGITTGTLSGVTNVYVEPYQNSDKSFAFDSILFNTGGDEKGIIDGSRVHFSEYSSFSKIGQSEMHSRVTVDHGQVEYGYLAYIWGSKMKYRNVKIPENSNYIAVYAGNKEPYDSMEFIFTYTKDGEEKRLGSTRTVNYNFQNDEFPAYVVIPPEVSADISGQVIDLYVEGGKTLEGNLSTADSFWFDFIEERIEPKVTDGATVYGGDFSWIVAQGDEIIPPRRRLTNGRDTTPFANNVWSGSTLLYENIAVDKDAKRLYCTTGAEEEYAGQKITFRYAKKNETQTKVLGTFVTTSNGLETDTGMEYIKLPAGFEAGEIDIYVDFGSTDTGKKATCNFFKFGFAK